MSVVERDRYFEQSTERDPALYLLPEGQEPQFVLAIDSERAELFRFGFDSWVAEDDIERHLTMPNGENRVLTHHGPNRTLERINRRSKNHKIEHGEAITIIESADGALYGHWNTFVKIGDRIGQPHNIRPLNADEVDQVFTVFVPPEAEVA